jgi:hypothetical protein
LTHIIQNDVLQPKKAQIVFPECVFGRFTHNFQVFNVSVFLGFLDTNQDQQSNKSPKRSICVISFRKPSPCQSRIPWEQKEQISPDKYGFNPCLRQEKVVLCTLW